MSIGPHIHILQTDNQHSENPFQTSRSFPNRTKDTSLMGDGLTSQNI